MLLAVNVLSVLVERREFRRVAVVLLDLLFNAFRGQDPETLLKAHKRVAAAAAASATSSRSAQQPRTSSSSARVRGVSSSTDPHRRPSQQPSTAPSASSKSHDLLAIARRVETSAKAAAYRAQAVVSYGDFRSAVHYDQSNGCEWKMLKLRARCTTTSPWM